MTKKDYVAAIKHIKSLGCSSSVRQFVMVAFADFFQQDNERFDRDRFLMAYQDSFEK